MKTISDSDLTTAIRCLDYLAESTKGRDLPLRELNLVRMGVVLSRKLKRK